MRRALLVVPVFSAFILAAGCEESTGLDITPILVSDTVIIGTPIGANGAPIAGNELVPNALDVTGDGMGGVYGGRFTDSSTDALQWDFALRFREGQLTLIPPAALDIVSRAALTNALQGQTFEGLEEAPAQNTFLTDVPVVMTEGSVYAARSRDAVSAFGTECPQFAKIKALDVDLATGRVELAILTNERCGDPRLVPTN